VLVALTDAGRDVLQQAIAIDAEGEQALLSGLTKADRRLLVSLLKKLLAGVEPIGAAAPG
jgi:DNA-binding MarR family transcriptional regulator